MSEDAVSLRLTAGAPVVHELFSKLGPKSEIVFTESNLSNHIAEFLTKRKIYKGQNNVLLWKKKYFQHW